ncbi:MAG: ABC transporter ATP-binding protein [Oligoflexia bacterium]|nr:ABC transporter ATP-binding protein [Oligoflexia bacterium]
MKPVSLDPDDIPHERRALGAERVELLSPTVDAPIVRAQGLGKRFDIFLNDRSRVYEFLGRRAHHTEHWALRGVDFDVQRGRSFGVIGPNGAGKSTLLKLIGGITRPTEGSLEVAATLSTLLDLGLGFHQDFTGRENIRLNCRLLGMDDADTESRIPDIIAFAELGAFIDLPVRTYSAGMQLRLGFSIVAHADSEIFLVDEVLAVGDQYFQRRCIRKIEDFLDAGRTIILVSHDLHAVRNLCDDVLWLDGGQVRMFGPARDVVDSYLDVERERAAGGRRVRNVPAFGTDRRSPDRTGTATTPPLRPAEYQATVHDPRLRQAVMDACAIDDPAKIWARPVPLEAPDVTDGDVPIIQGSGEVRIISVRLLDSSGRPRERFRTGEDLLVAVTFRTTEPVPHPIFGAAIFRSDGVYIHGPNSRYDDVLDGTYHGIYTFFIVWRSLPLLSGRYRLSVAVFDEHHLKPHAWHNQLYDFEVASPIEDHGIALLDHAWGLITHHQEG